MKNIVFTVFSVFLSIIVFCLVWWQWKNYGVVGEQKKIAFETPDVKSRLPQIYAVNRRILQYEKIAVSHLAKAVDVDGHDINDELCCYDEKGEKISGFFDTSRPGKFLLKWKVRSQVNGRRAEKSILVLVDGRVCS